MKISIVISAFLILFFAFSALAEEICPGSDKWPVASGVEELKMYEKDFTIDKAMKSVSFLEKDVIKIIKEHEHKKSYSILDYEGFYIGYPNSLAFVKGTLLKQEARNAKNKLEIEKLKLNNNKNIKEDVSKAEKAYLAAKKKFCDFLKEAEYVD
jgi:hypothetical protein